MAKHKQGHQAWGMVFGKSIKEVHFLIPLILGVFLLACLLGYNKSDPGWSTSGTGEVRNYFGAPGAFIADISISILGYASYFFAIGLLAISVSVVFSYRNNRFDQDHDKKSMWLSWLALFCGTLVFSGMLSLHLKKEINQVAVTYGGWLGQYLNAFACSAFAASKVMLCYLLIFAFSITRIFRINWPKIWLFIGDVFLSLCALISGKAMPSISLAISSLFGEAKHCFKRVLNSNREQTDEEIRAAVAAEFAAEQELQRLQRESSPSLFEVPENNNSYTTATKTEPSLNISGFADEVIAGKQEESSSSFYDYAEEKSVDNIDTVEDKPDPFEAARQRAANLARARENAAASLASQKYDAYDDEYTRNNEEIDAFAAAFAQKQSRSVSASDVDSVSPRNISQSFNPEQYRSEVKPAEPITGGVGGGGLKLNARSFNSNRFYSEKFNEPKLAENISSRLASVAAPDNFAGSDSPKRVATAGLPDYENDHRYAYKQDNKQNVAAKGYANEYVKPPLSLLGIAPPHSMPSAQEQFAHYAPLVEQALRNYKVEATVVDVSVGPVVTCLELELAPGVKVSRIVSLEKDLARSIAVRSVRIVEVIPGKPYIGLEIPNQKRETVYLSEVLESQEYQREKSPLTAVLGVGINGTPAVADVAKMPHLLIAGTTGSGKSVAINVMLSSMLYKATPDELRLILIDPKMLELNMYNDIPHLLTPVVDDMEQAENALRWAVAEMERRYQLMAAFKVRKITEFNQKIMQIKEQTGEVLDPLWQPDPSQLGAANKPPQIEPLPYIVIVIDELADMMMSVGKKVEPLIVRIAQKARAAGIHLILATQRPSVDVITGLIKANVPSRLAFRVSSKYDARTVEVPGAETLLGNGDGLFSIDNRLVRVHGAFMKDEEVEAVTEYLKTQGEPKYEESITSPVPASALGNFMVDDSASDNENDELYDEACRIVIESGKASISGLQRRLNIGYNRAARMIEAMQMAGLVSEPGSNGTRRVLVGGD